MENKNKRSRITRDPNPELKLTPGEQLLIWRRRKKWNQTQAAKYHKLSIFYYKLTEYDVIESKTRKLTSLLPLRDYEKCFIYRKRMNKTQPEMAKLIGIGRYWLRLQETGQVPCDKLLDWWENATTKN